MGIVLEWMPDLNYIAYICLMKLFRKHIRIEM